MPMIRRLLVVLVLIALAPGTVLAQAPQPRLLIDMYSGEVLYEDDAGRPWHPASLTKLMTALLAFEAIESGRVTLNTPVVTSAYALTAAPSRMGLPVDMAISLEDALYALIVKSANDIAIAIAETIGGNEASFVAMMNQRALQLGMTGTYFVNPHGLHDPRQVTTARDMALLALNIRLRFPHYDPMFATHAVAYEGRVDRANNELLLGFAGTDGMKTGYVCASGLNIVATANRNGRALMAVVLGGSSSRERGQSTAQLLGSGFSGGYTGTGRTVLDVANRGDLAPFDMRPLVCGAGAEAYVAERAQAFSAGLEGSVDYLGAGLSAGAPHRITLLGRLRDVPLPLPRPDWLPVVTAGAAMDPVAPSGDAPGMLPVLHPVPLPLPRPAWL